MTNEADIRKLHHVALVYIAVRLGKENSFAEVALTDNNVFPKSKTQMCYPPNQRCLYVVWKDKKPLQATRGTFTTSPSRKGRSGSGGSILPKNRTVSTPLRYQSRAEEIIGKN
jgi:hypothetical protein